MMVAAGFFMFTTGIMALSGVFWWSYQKSADKLYYLQILNNLSTTINSSPTNSVCDEKHKIFLQQVVYALTQNLPSRKLVKTAFKDKTLNVDVSTNLTDVSTENLQLANVSHDIRMFLQGFYNKMVTVPASDRKSDGCYTMRKLTQEEVDLFISKILNEKNKIITKADEELAA